MQEKKGVSIDMLHGPLLRRIVVFALPLMLSGILQQSFNSVDVAVVGHYCGSEALAAVGSNGMVISILLNLFVGISVGTNVVIANFIGQNNADGIRRSIRTTALLALVSGVLLLALGVALAGPILRAMSTPDDVIGLATEYLEIYFLGMPFLMIYNFGSAILRSMGDTRRPFYALMAGGVVNVALNLLFVIGMDMGVAGVGIATVIATAVNAAFIVRWLMRESGPYRLDLSSLRPSMPEMRKILAIGLPAGLQGMVFSFANIFIQSAVNSYGSAAVAGSAAALIYEYYCYFIISAFAQACVAFVSQNYGAGQYVRVRRTMLICMGLSVICAGIANVAIYLNSHFFLSFFTDRPEVFRYGYIRLEYVLLFQFIASSYEVAGGALRGLGYSMTPTVLTILGTCVLRLVWVTYVSRGADDFGFLLSVYPLSWVVTGVAVVVAYFVVARRVAPVRA